MNQEIVDSFSLFLAYTILISVGYSWQRYLQILDQSKEIQKEKEFNRNIALDDNPVDIQEKQYTLRSIKQQDLIGLFELYLFSNEQFKQNKQSFYQQYNLDWIMPFIYLQQSNYLFDKALSIFGIQFILEIGLNTLNEKVDLDVVSKLNTLLQKL